MPAPTRTRRPTRAPTDPETTATVIAAIRRNFDPVHGGFGSQPKFPHPDALRLTLEEYARTGDADLHGASFAGRARASG